MKMWKWVFGALKDTNSLLKASLIPRSALQNPDIEAAVVKATSHSDSHIDYGSAQRIFAWVRVSSNYLRPVLCALSNRMKRTHSWTVALKGLMLMHGVFCSKAPAIKKIGPLPFDLSGFKDRSPDKHDHEAFVRAYYKYLNQKSLFVSLQSEEKQKDSSMKQDLVRLEKLQGLLDVLLEIKPRSDMMTNILVLEAMHGIVIEICDIYSRICIGIAGILVRIYSTGKTEATMALSVLHKATIQSRDLSSYLKFCKDSGVVNALECPKIEHIPDEDIRELERIINRDS